MRVAAGFILVIAAALVIGVAAGTVWHEVYQARLP